MHTERIATSVFCKYFSGIAAPLRIGGAVVFQLCRDIFQQDFVLVIACMQENTKQPTHTTPGPAHHCGLLLARRYRFGVDPFWWRRHMCHDTKEIRVYLSRASQ